MKILKIYMNKYSTIIAIIFSLSTNSFADEVSQLKVTRFIVSNCEIAAEMYSKYAVWVSNNFEKIYSNSTPKSKKRDDLIAKFELKNNEYIDDDFLERKRISNIYKDEFMLKELLFKLLDNSRQIAYNSAVNNRGFTQLQFQRHIEEECKRPHFDLLGK